MPKQLQQQSKTIIMNVLRYFQNQRDRPGPNVPLTSVIQRTAEACGVSEKTISGIKKQFEEPAVVEQIASPPTRNVLKKESIDVDDFVKDAVRRKIYDMNSKGQYFTLKSLKEILKKDEIFDFSTSCLRNLLIHLGFSYKVDDPRRGLFEREDIAAKRAQFLRQYFKNKEEKLYDVFLDETWVYQRGSKTKTWHDSNLLSLKKKTISEGKRYMIVHAGNKNGFIDGASLIFSTTNKKMDYHDNMDADLFKNWFSDKLIPNLEDPSLIIMDNATYHSKLIKKLKNSNWTKDQLKQFLIEKNIPHNSDMLRVELLNLAMSNLPNKQYEIDLLAEQYGHKILRLPPHHCEFNPIENIWGICKNYYNRNIDSEGYSNENVLNTWDKALKTVDGGMWRRSIEKAENKMLEWWNIQKTYDNTQQPVVIHLNSDESSDEELSDYG